MSGYVACNWVSRGVWRFLSRFVWSVKILHLQSCRGRVQDDKQAVGLKFRVVGLVIEGRFGFGVSKRQAGHVRELRILDSDDFILDSCESLNPKTLTPLTPSYECYLILRSF